MNKNNKLLLSFTKYCHENPEQRFWQALRNWAGYNFILTSTRFDGEMFNPDFMEQHHVEVSDTFYWEDK